MKIRLSVCLFALIVLLVGCSTTKLRNEQLASVAKDWSLVIRASQVIPVYPLTEDLRPGDVLLVTTAIDEQAEMYKEKGFLPLDQLLVRLYSDSFETFYNGRYGTSSGQIPPAQWEDDGSGNSNWGIAPRAAFPTYQFSVETGSGLNLAIPIQGVPFALGLMNSGKASGTVTIADTYTYGLDNHDLSALVRKWGLGQRALLSNYAPVAGQHQFLRVVSRVYLTKRVSVTINNDEAKGAKANVGEEESTVDLMTAEKNNSEENYEEMLTKVNELAKRQIPGGGLTISTATGRSVSLNEEFERPMVIGYVGFDLPIMAGGRLGAPVSTIDQLTGRSETVRPYQVTSVYRLASYQFIVAALEEADEASAATIKHDLNGLVSVLPDVYPFTLCEGGLTVSDEIVRGTPVASVDIYSVLDYAGNAESTIDALERNLSSLPTGTDPEREFVLEMTNNLAEARAAFQSVMQAVGSSAAMTAAVDYVMLGIEH